MLYVKNSRELNDKIEIVKNYLSYANNSSRIRCLEKMSK